MSSGSQTSGRPKPKPKVLNPIDSMAHVAGQDQQVGPGDLLAVLLLDRPEQPARLVEVRVVRPAIQRSEALLAFAAAAAPVGDAVGAGGVPRHADEEPPVVAVIRRPPVLRLRHQRDEIPLQRLDVEGLELLRVVEVLPHRIRQVRSGGGAPRDSSCIRPPVLVRPRPAVLGVGEGITGFSLSLTLWVCSLSGMRPSPLCYGWRFPGNSTAHPLRQWTVTGALKSSASWAPCPLGLDWPGAPGSISVHVSLPSRPS